MPEGVIADGWSYVIAAYSITTVVLVAYAWSLWKRNQNANRTRNSDE